MDRYTVFIPVGAAESSSEPAPTEPPAAAPADESPATTTIDLSAIGLGASIVALDRQTGALRWTTPLETSVPPVVVGDMLIVASARQLHALSTATGRPLWTLAIEGSVRGRMVVSANGLLVAFTEPDRLMAVDTSARAVAWVRSIGESGPVAMTTGGESVYLTTPTSRVLDIALEDGEVRWQRQLTGTLSEPALGKERLFVGSDTDTLWALDPESGADKWTWVRRIFGGDVVGAAAEDDRVFVASKDNIIRALDRGNGNQEWKLDIGTRPQLPPRVFFGTVVVIGLAPTVSTFLAKEGTAVSTWSAPENAELAGPPLIDEHLQPFGVAMVVILRDGRVVAARPREMDLEGPSAARITFLPGRPLSVESLPGSEPATVLPAAPAVPAR